MSVTVRAGDLANYGRRLVIAISIMCAGCFTRHVTGTTLPPDKTCTGSWTAIVVNDTDRYYDLFIGNRLVGTAEPRATSRSVIDPRFGQVTPSIRESAVTRDQLGPRLRSDALRMVCE